METIQQISEWILFIVFILPTVITGLTKYPNLTKSATVKAWLSKILDVLSLVTHKDSPGTFKAPLVPSKAPPVVDSVTVTPTPPAP